MKQARTLAQGLVTPSLPQLWLTAMLRAFVELVQNVVATFQMIRLRFPRDWHTRETETFLPEGTDGTQQQETETVAASDSYPTALMVSSTQSVRPSNHEGALTAPRSEPHGSVPMVRVPREGGDPVLLNEKRAKRSNSLQHKAHRLRWTPAFAGDACCSNTSKSA